MLVRSKGVVEDVTLHPAGEIGDSGVLDRHDAKTLESVGGVGLKITGGREEFRAGFGGYVV
jgi:hypothetical protein